MLSRSGLTQYVRASTGLWIMAIVAALAAVTFAFRTAFPTNHDVAWILEGAGRLLEGGRFGRDVVDVNPPLVWWLAMIPAKVAILTETSVRQVWLVFVFLLVLVSLALTSMVIGDGAVPGRRRLVLLLAIACVLVIAPGYDFGQREHLMLIFAMPYLGLAALRTERASSNIALALSIGAFGATGFCLKPYFLAVPLFLEILIALRSGSFGAWIRPEIFAATVVAVGYLAAVHEFAPDYLGTVVPNALAGYWAYGEPLPLVVWGTLQQWVPYAVAATLVLLLGGVQVVSPFALSCFVGSLGAMASAVAQQKGWPYHFLPMTGMAATGMASMAVRIGSREGLRTSQVLATVFATAIFALPLIEQARTRGFVREQNIRVERLAQIFAAHASPGETIYGFITSPRDVHPALLASGRGWATAACCLYLLPALVRIDEADPADVPRIMAAAKGQIAGVLSDLEARRPAVIVVDSKSDKLGFGGRRFDYLDYFLRDPRFVALWKNYRESDPVPPFRIFLRTDLPAGSGIESE